MLEQDLPLEEIIYFRMRCAMSHSGLLRSSEYAKTLAPLLNAMKNNPHVPMHRNEEAVIRGKQARL